MRKKENKENIIILYYVVAVLIVIGLFNLYLKVNETPHNPDKYNQLRVEFESNKDLILLCYWGEDSYRINDIFYGEYYDEKMKRYPVVFNGLDDFGNAKIYTKKEVYEKAGLTDEKFRYLTTQMKELKFSCIDKGQTYIEFIYGGLLGEYGGVLYSPKKPILKKDYMNVKQIEKGWYIFSRS